MNVKQLTLWSIVAVLFAGSALFVYVLGAYVGAEPNPMLWSGPGRFFHVVFTLAAWWVMAWVATEINDYMERSK